MAYKSKRPQSRKFSVSLSDKDGEILKLYAQKHGMTRPDAIRKILREHLRPYAEMVAKEGPENQLGLFDILQMDIFDNARPVEKQ